MYTSASKYQLFAVVQQDGKSLAYFSRELTKTQMRCTTEEKELLSIVETLKEFKKMLLGYLNTVRIVSDLRELNKIIDRAPFPALSIQKVIQSLVGFHWFSYRSEHRLLLYSSRSHCPKAIYNCVHMGKIFL